MPTKGISADGATLAAGQCAIVRVNKVDDIFPNIVAPGFAVRAGTMVEIERAFTGWGICQWLNNDHGAADPFEDRVLDALLQTPLFPFRGVLEVIAAPAVQKVKHRITSLSGDVVTRRKIDDDLAVQAQ